MSYWIVIACIRIGTYLLAHEQICLLSGDVFSLYALKVHRLNSQSTTEQAQLSVREWEMRL